MKKWLSVLFFTLISTSGLGSARADFNLVNIDMASPETQNAQELYGRAYGFQPVQVAPVMRAPAEEIPAILKVAQAAGTLPLSVFMLRQAGMDYGQIMQQFAVAPLVPAGQQVTNAYYVNRARQNFLVDMLQVDPVLVPMIPARGPAFTRFIAYPVHPKMGYWMPPGQAKKYGIWIPPGQAKKMGLWDGRWGHDRWRGWDWDDKDWQGYGKPGKDDYYYGKKGKYYKAKGDKDYKHHGGHGHGNKGSKGKGKGKGKK